MLFTMGHSFGKHVQVHAPLSCSGLAVTCSGAGKASPTSPSVFLWKRKELQCFLVIANYSKEDCFYLCESDGDPHTFTNARGQGWTEPEPDRPSICWVYLQIPTIAQGWTGWLKPGVPSRSPVWIAGTQELEPFFPASQDVHSQEVESGVLELGLSLKKKVFEGQKQKRRKDKHIE